MYAQKINILHIANDFSGSAVYSELGKKLDSYDVGQIFYTAIRSNTKINNSINFRNSFSKVIYSHILNNFFDRLFYPYKIYKIFSDIQKKIDFSKISIIHAHTWYSDGGVAYLLSRKYNIPYIISVRNTDVNIFCKYAIYLNSFATKVLDSSSSIILISNVYYSKLIELNFLKSKFNSLSRKINIIPNGVNDFWLKNSIKSTELKFDTSTRKFFNCIYVGKFDLNKNIFNLQKAIILLNEKFEGYNIQLNIVGGGGGYEKEVLNLVNKYPQYFNYYGVVKDKQQLSNIYRNNDFFAMPSKFETFGLVYIEAMLNGLPILYTHKEGIDEYYTENIGKKVFSFDSSHIAEVLKSMIDAYHTYDIPIEKIKKNHDWALIAEKYLKIYESAIKSFN